MKVELIPVVEVTFIVIEEIRPDNNRYWECSEIWDKYRDECRKKQGYKDKFIPYLNGNNLYKPSEITDTNLAKFAVEHAIMLSDNISVPLLDTCPFYGGYVLRIDGIDKSYPQCCGDLSDIFYWKALSNGHVSNCEEHPGPRISFEGNNVVPDFTVGEFDEFFEPEPPDTVVSINRFELQKAVENVIAELKAFEKRLFTINKTEKLNIDNVVKLLTWGDRERE